MKPSCSFSLFVLILAEIPWIQHVQSWAHHMISYEHLTQKYIRLGCFCGFWWGLSSCLQSRTSTEWSWCLSSEKDCWSRRSFCKTLLPFLSIFQTFVNESIPDPGWVRGSKLHSSRNFESAETSLWGLCCFPHLQICFHYSITFVNIHKLPWGTWSFATLQDPWKHSDFDRMLIWSAGE